MLYTFAEQMKWMCLPVSLLWTMEMVIMITVELQQVKTREMRKGNRVRSAKAKPNKSIIIHICVCIAFTRIFEASTHQIPKFRLANSTPKSFRNSCAVYNNIVVFAKHFCLSYRRKFHSLHHLLMQEFGWLRMAKTPPYRSFCTMLMRKWFERDFQTI